jgi:predicted transposase YdaD
MTKKADIGSKRLISLSPDNWAQWVTQIPNLKTLEILSSEFQWVSRRCINEGFITRTGFIFTAE